MSPWRRGAAVVLPLLALAVLTSCAPANRAAGEPAALARTNQVDLPPSYIFRPEAIEVTPGTTVTWTNHDNFSHSVQVQGQADVHVMKPGESAQITFDQPGTYSYVCTFHTQNMRGTVVVRGA